MAHGDNEQAGLRNWAVRRHSNKQWRSPGDARCGTPRSAHWTINIDQASAVRGTRASRTSRVVAPPSIVARIGSGSARGSRSEPESRHSRARCVAARSSNERASWPRAIAMAWRKHACARGRSGSGRSSAIRPSRRCNSASQQRSPSCSTKTKPSCGAASALGASSAFSNASASWDTRADSVIPALDRRSACIAARIAAILSTVGSRGCRASVARSLARRTGAGEAASPIPGRIGHYLLSGADQPMGSCASGDRGESSSSIDDGKKLEQYQ